jgi:hypothetical protein
MKNSILIFSFVFIFIFKSDSQIKYDSTKNEYSYSEVLQTPNKNISKLYNSVNIWFATYYYLTAEMFRQLYDEKNQRFIWNTFNYIKVLKSDSSKSPTELKIKYTNTVKIYETYAKFEITNIKISSIKETDEHKLEYYNNSNDNSKSEILKQINESFISTFKSFKKYIVENTN